MKLSSRSRKALFLTTPLIIILSLSLILPDSVFAQTQSWDQIDASCVRQGDVATIQGIMCLLANVLSISLTVIGVIGFVMMIYGSLKWMLAGGNSQEVDSAGKTMLFAVVGLVVALSSFMIINIISRFTGIGTIQEFFIPNSDYDWSQQLNPSNQDPYRDAGANP